MLDALLFVQILLWVAMVAAFLWAFYLTRLPAILVYGLWGKAVLKS